MAKVVLIKCDSYDYSSVKKAVGRGLELLGGCRVWVAEGEKILLKPNLLSAQPPEKCVTTHPAVFRAVAEALLEAGAVVTYGDSPALGNPERVARKAGIMAVAEELGLELADFRQGRDVDFPHGSQNKKFTIANGVLASNGLVSLPKLKTHGLMTITGAVKNQFGCIPGPLKGEFHLRLPQPEDFARMLVDLTRLLSPRLFVMDAVIAMEGNGPQNGRPKKLGFILMSTDAVALDATACRLIGLNPGQVLTVKYGQEFGLGSYHEGDLEIIGDSRQDLVIRDFDAAKTRTALAGRGSRYLRNAVVPRPTIAEKVCTRCGTCIQMCPVKPPAVDWTDPDKQATPAYQYDRCIRCYCCQEVCPEGAITLYTPFLGRLLHRTSLPS